MFTRKGCFQCFFKVIIRAAATSRQLQLFPNKGEATFWNSKSDEAETSQCQ